MTAMGLHEQVKCSLEVAPDQAGVLSEAELAAMVLPEQTETPSVKNSLSRGMVGWVREVCARKHSVVAVVICCCFQLFFFFQS